MRGIRHDAFLDLSLGAIAALGEAQAEAVGQVGARTMVDARRCAAVSVREYRARRWRSILWHGRKDAAVVQATSEESGGSFEWPLGGLQAARRAAAPPASGEDVRPGTGADDASRSSEA
jgi:hypothetical protein